MNIICLAVEVYIKLLDDTMKDVLMNAGGG